MVDFDVLIAGGGPAGLSAAISLAGLGLSVAIIERQKAVDLAAPPFDGRDIALTKLSRQVLTEFGAWAKFAPDEVSVIDSARVLNGHGPGALRFDLPAGRQEALGYLVSNHVIRRALFAVASARQGITLIEGQQVVAAHAAVDTACVEVNDGRRITARLLIAADSRFSEVRRMLGLGADATPFGKTMHVFRMSHERPHRHTAFECFNYGHTLALLPLNGLRSSVVLTVKTSESEAMSARSDTAIGSIVADGFGHRFGQMEVVSSRHAYPLIGVYARRFAASRFALVGDAAVGMHLVTAHGFNFGLQGQAILAECVASALVQGRDIGGADVLERYETRHRRSTLPLYMATNAIARLYTNDAPPARFVRHALLAAADRFGPAKKLIMSRLGEIPPGGAVG